MIDHIAVTNHLGDRLVMPLRNPYDSGLAIKKVEGIGPAKGTINLTDISTSDGSIFNSSRVGNRNIVLTLEFVPDFAKGRSIEDVRLETYKYFPVKHPLTFEVVTDRRKAAIVGYVESNEPDIFSDREGCEISILCPDPYFYALDIHGSDADGFSAIQGGFEFIFSNEDLKKALLHFSDLKLLEEINIPYSGDADTGMVIHVHAIGAATNIAIVKPREYLQMNVDTDKFSTVKGLTNGLVAGDDLYIDTRRGHKGMTLVRGGKKYNVINALDRGSDWLKLSHGDNIFSYKAGTGGVYLQINLEYNTIYEGV